MQHDIPIHILLVEDSLSDARLLQEALADVTSVRFELIHVLRLADALQHLELTPIDIVLLDLSLPDSQGIDTFYKLHLHHTHVPIIVMTSLADETFAVGIIGSGAQDYLIKGDLDGPMVMRTIRYAIKRNCVQLELQSLSLTDEMTGLLNRRGFFVRAAQQIKLAHRHQATLLVIYVDVDGLKRINDTFGHDVGSQLIIDVAHILRLTFRETDIISRFGGDEYVILGIDATSNDRAAVINRLEANIRDHNAHSQRVYELSISLGVVLFDPQLGLTIEDAIVDADQAMYQQKHCRQLARGA